MSSKKVTSSSEKKSVVSSDKKSELSVSKTRKQPPKKVIVKSKVSASSDIMVKSPIKHAIPKPPIVVPPVINSLDDAVIVNQPASVVTQIAPESSNQALTGSCGMPNIDFSRPEYMFAALQSLFQSSMGVNPAGVSGQPVTSTVGAPWESIKGCTGSSLPSRRLTECDFSAPRRFTPRSVRTSFPEGGMPAYRMTLHVRHPLRVNKATRGSIWVATLNWGSCTMVWELGSRFSPVHGRIRCGVRDRVLVLERYSRVPCHPKGQVQVALDLRLVGE
jgi:hypothetical protein